LGRDTLVCGINYQPEVNNRPDETLFDGSDPHLPGRGRSAQFHGGGDPARRHARCRQQGRQAARSAAWRDRPGAQYAPSGAHRSGQRLYASLLAATSQIDEAFLALTRYRDRPAGTLRLTVPRALGALVLKDLAPRFQRAYPDVALDISLDDGEVDLLEQGFDAGIRLGQQVAQGMVAVRLTDDLAWSVVGAPAYLARAGRPRIPEDLVRHATVRYRFHRSRALAPWSFVRDGDRFQVETGQQLVANDTGLIADFVRSGLGLAYLPDIEIAATWRRDGSSACCNLSCRARRGCSCTSPPKPRASPSCAR